MTAHVDASRVVYFKDGQKVGEYVGDSYPALEVSVIRTTFANSSKWADG